MARIYLELGSNIMPDRNLDIALGHLAKAVKLEKISTVYRTVAIGRYSNYFYNCVAGCQSELDPVNLKQKVITPIETEMGRSIYRKKLSDRTIDIDLLIYDDLVSKELNIPHDDIFNKPFVAVGLCEIAPDLRVFPTFKTPCDISSKMDRSGMVALVDYTSKLRSKHINQI